MNYLTHNRSFNSNPIIWVTVCMGCKKIRNDEGDWLHADITQLVQPYVELTHGICPKCGPKLFPEYWEQEK
jgi:hypothetical protein